MMMTNLFSIFDPSLVMFSFVWFLIFIYLMFIPSFYNMSGNFINLFFNFLLIVKNEINYVIVNPFKGCYLFIGSIFISIITYNFLSLFPYIFSFTSHLLVTFPCSFSFWLCVVVFNFFSFFKKFLSHLIPVGTPLALVSFMVIVEILSNFIRPVALTFRLTANMMAGHLLMSLIGGAVISMPLSIFLLGSLFQSFLVIMELGVSVIQAYVFSTLILLYMSEV